MSAVSSGSASAQNVCAPRASSNASIGHVMGNVAARATLLERHMHICDVRREHLARARRARRRGSTTRARSSRRAACRRATCPGTATKGAASSVTVGLLTSVAKFSAATCSRLSRRRFRRISLNSNLQAGDPYSSYYYWKKDTIEAFLYGVRGRAVFISP